jgi:(p)ppGpp synthase/HD superfamily hydrolase
MVYDQGRPGGVGGFDNLKGYFIQTPEHWNAWPLEENARLAYTHKESDETDAALLDRAVAYAHQKYAGLYRSSTDRVPVALPYIVHPMDVMQRVANFGIEDTDMLVAALLHDLLEDTKTPAIELGNQFGPRVQNFVQCLTYNKIDGSKQEYLNNLCMFEIQALMIKLADRASNVESFRHGTPDYAGTYARKADCIYKSVLGRREEILLHFGEHVCANAANLANELLNF